LRPLAPSMPCSRQIGQCKASFPRR
jgi:hypothetical protein